MNDGDNDARGEKKQTMQTIATLYEECNVIELTIRDEGRKNCPSKMVTAGSYVFIKCPQISSWQWHPFSVTPVCIVLLLLFLCANVKAALFCTLPLH